MCNPLILCKLASVIRCDRLEMLSHVGPPPPYRLIHRRGLLTMLELFHDEEVRAALHHREDGIAVLVDNQVHLPVSEPAAVNLLGTFVYACLVPDALGLGLMPVPGVVAILHLVSAVCGKRTACVVAEHLVKWSREISLHPPLQSSWIFVWETIAPQ